MAARAYNETVERVCAESNRAGGMIDGVVEGRRGVEGTGKEADDSGDSAAADGVAVFVAEESNTSP